MAQELAGVLGEILLRSGMCLGQPIIEIKPADLIQTFSVCAQLGFDFLVDLTAVDFPGRAERFEVIYTLHSFSRAARIRVKTHTAGAIPSIANIHAGANWLEREAFDMFGIRFAGHPHLTRILLPDEWNGHPLRRDYGITQMDNQWVANNLGIPSGQ